MILALAATAGLLVYVQRLRQRVRRQSADLARRENVIADLRARLGHARRMEAVGLYAGSITHNLNNLLSVILGHLRLADRTAVSADEGADLGKAATAARMAAGLLADLGAFYRQADLDRKPTDLGPVVRDTVKLLGDLLPPSVEIQADLQPCGPVLASASSIQQILMILCGQSASGQRVGRGRIHITLREEIVAASRQAHPRPLEAGHYVRLSIHDDREGLDPERLREILAAHYGQSSDEEAPELGLATVTHLVEHMQASVVASSHRGDGVAFSIYLPLIAWTVPQPEPDLSRLPETSPPPEIAPSVPAVRVLLVDDEEMVAEILARGLRHLGHTVTMTSDSRRALEIFRKDPGAFDVVITDQIMPHMSGVRLARELVGVRPGVPVILVTGFLESYHAQQARAAGVREFVTKPCSHLDLAQAIGRLGLGRLEGRA